MKKKRKKMLSSSTQSLKIPNVKMNNGLTIPALGFGTERTAGSPSFLEGAIKYAVSIGYRHFDGAWVYFNDPSLAKAIKEAMTESGGKISRDQLTLACKVWNTFHSKQGVTLAVDSTLTNLNIDYVDIMYIHWPMGFKENVGTDAFPKDEQGKVMYSDVDYMETYRALEEFVDQGLIKSIGLSNLNKEQCENVLKNCRIKPACIQIEVHPYFQNDKLVEFCQNNGILVVGYSALGAADLAESREHIPNVLEDEKLAKIGKKYNKSVAQVCLRWSIQRGCVPLVKALEPEKILENGQIFDFELSDEDMKEIKKVNKNCRVCKVPQYKDHPYYPFKDDE